MVEAEASASRWTGRFGEVKSDLCISDRPFDAAVAGSSSTEAVLVWRWSHWVAEEGEEPEVGARTKSPQIPLAHGEDVAADVARN